MKELICQYCQEEFEAEKTREFCSAQCRKLYLQGYNHCLFQKQRPIYEKESQGQIRW